MMKLGAENEEVALEKADTDIVLEWINPAGNKSRWRLNPKKFPSFSVAVK